MNTKNAIIKSTQLGGEDHGIFTFWLNLDYGGSGQVAGGYGLDEPIKIDDKFSHREMTKLGGMLIQKILEVVDVDSWESLPQKSVRAIMDTDKKFGGLVVGLMNYLDDDNYVLFKEHFKNNPTVE